MDQVWSISLLGSLRLSMPKLLIVKGLLEGTQLYGRSEVEHIPVTMAAV